MRACDNTNILRKNKQLIHVNPAMATMKSTDGATLCDKYLPLRRLSIQQSHCRNVELLDQSTCSLVTLQMTSSTVAQHRKDALRLRYVILTPCCCCYHLCVLTDVVAHLISYRINATSALWRMRTMRYTSTLCRLRINQTDRQTGKIREITCIARRTVTLQFVKYREM